ncbi:MAG: CYTH domain-containing protein [Patescibacteria group bacterium]
MEEFEIKFLEVDVPELEKKLLEIGAKKIGEYNYRRVLMDYPDLRMENKHSWLRLRTNGEETTLSYKERIGIKENGQVGSDDGMKEIEISVDDYDKTFELLKSIGLIIKREEENKRLRYTKGDAVFDIDLWPQIPPYVEVESTTLENAKKAAREAGFDPEEGLVCSAKQIYKKYGYDLNDYITITFDKFIKK